MKFKQFILLLFVSFALSIFPAFAEEATVFSDVTPDAWYADSVEYVFENGLMNGTGKTTFGPEDHITRGMIVTIIHRMEGSPTAIYTSEYTDVKKEYYYYSPVMWASENGIVNGYSKEIFAPDAKITREQFATILYRYASYKGLDVSFDSEVVEQLKKFEDNGSVNNYAKDAISWANHSKLITGTTDATLNPQGTATRAQAATIFMRFEKWMTEAEGKRDNEKEVTNAPEVPEENVREDNKAKKDEEDDEDENDEETEIEVKVEDKDKEITEKKEENHDKSEEQDSSDNTSQGKDDEQDEEPPHSSGTVKDEEAKDDTSESEKENDDTTNSNANNDYQGLYLKVNDSEVTSENRVEVSVLLENNPGIMGMLISFEYDEAAMKLVKVSNGEVLSEKYGYIFTAPKNMASGCRASWYTLEDECTTASGTFVTLVFEVFASTQKGSYPVTIRYDSDDVIDRNEAPLALKVIDGKIIIK